MTLVRLDTLVRAACACLVALALTAGCDGRDADEADPSTDAAAEAEAEPEAPAEAETAAPAPARGQASAATAPVTVDDIDRWQKGMAGELEAVRAGGERMKNAKTGEDTLSAMMAVQEAATQEAGAKAAGLDLERYKHVRSNLSAAAAYLTPQLGGIDTTMLSADQRAELRQMNEARLKQLEEDVPAEVLAALRPRAEALRKQELELVGTRLKSAGM